MRLGSKLATSCAAAMRRFRRTWRRQAGAVRATQPLSVFCPCSVRRTPEISVKAVYALLGISDTWSCWVALSLGRNCPHNPTIGLGRAEPSFFPGIRNCIPFPFPHRRGVRRLWAHHGVEMFAVDHLSRPGTRLDGAQRSRRAASRKWVSLGGRGATLWCASTS